MPYLYKALPAWKTKGNTFKRDITQHLCYHGPITGEDAKLKLQQQVGNCYLVRYSNSQDQYILSVLKKGDDSAEILQHFVINIETMHYQHEYEIEGSEKRFDDFSRLLQFYENNQISPEIECIGSPCYISLPSPNTPWPQGEGGLQDASYFDRCNTFPRHMNDLSRFFPLVDSHVPRSTSTPSINNTLLRKIDGIATNFTDTPI